MSKEIKTRHGEAGGRAKKGVGKEGGKIGVEVFRRGKPLNI